MNRSDRQADQTEHILLDVWEEPRHTIVPVWLRTGPDPRIRLLVGVVHLNAVA